ncbi:MAG: TIGR02186 family protein, partial [Pseudomonadota bacterium]
MILRMLLLLALFTGIPAKAEEVVAGLSQSRVAITASFTGSEIFVFGAVKRAAPPPEGVLDVIVVVEGPSHPVLVRKRERQFGVWVNGPGVQVDAAPSLYAVNTTRPFRDVISWTEELRHQVGLAEVIRLIDAPD